MILLYSKGVELNFIGGQVALGRLALSVYSLHITIITIWRPQHAVFQRRDVLFALEQKKGKFYIFKICLIFSYIENFHKYYYFFLIGRAGSGRHCSFFLSGCHESHDGHASPIANSAKGIRVCCGWCRICQPRCLQPILIGFEGKVMGSQSGFSRAWQGWHVRLAGQGFGSALADNQHHWVWHD